MPRGCGDFQIKLQTIIDPFLWKRIFISATENTVSRTL